MAQVKNNERLEHDTYKLDFYRSAERVKSGGEVFTPPALVREILDQLPKESFSDPTKTTLDPACGDGAFLIEVLARKIAAGVDCFIALGTTYGIDIQPTNVALCRNRLVTYILNTHHVVDADKEAFSDRLHMLASHQIQQGNSLTDDLDKMFSKKDRLFA